MPIDPRRRDAITEVVAAYNGANPRMRLPRNAGRLLVVMFPVEDVCPRSLNDLALEGFDRSNLPGVLRRLIEVGFVSKEQGVSRAPNVYRLHLPPRAQP
jgi:hypothetical protein